MPPAVLYTPSHPHAHVQHILYARRKQSGHMHDAVLTRTGIADAMRCCLVLMDALVPLVDGRVLKEPPVITPANMTQQCQCDDHGGARRNAIGARLLCHAVGHFRMPRGIACTKLGVNNAQTSGVCLTPTPEAGDRDGNGELRIIPRFAQVADQIHHYQPQHRRSMSNLVNTCCR